MLRTNPRKQLSLIACPNVNNSALWQLHSIRVNFLPNDRVDLETRDLVDKLLDVKLFKSGECCYVERFHVIDDVLIRFPAFESDFVTTEMRVVVRKNLDNFFHEVEDEIVVAINDWVDRAKFALVRSSTLG